MNCLNNETIQAFLDNELTPEQKFDAQTHINSCSLCKANVANYKKELQQIASLLNSNISDHQDITIPEFIAPKPKKRKPVSRILVFAAAAVIVTIIGISTIIKHQNETEKKRQMLAMQNWEILQQTSMNEQWQERMVTITITDKDGNIVEQFITSE